MIAMNLRYQTVEPVVLFIASITVLDVIESAVSELNQVYSPSG